MGRVAGILKHIPFALDVLLFPLRPPPVHSFFTSKPEGSSDCYDF